MARVKKKQIDNNKIGQITTLSFVATGSSDDVTTAINTSISNESVSLVPSNGNESSIGVLVTTPINKVQLISSSNKELIFDNDGNEIYGRLTESSGIYTLSYYSLQSGAEIVANINNTIDFFINYNFSFKDFPFDNSVRVANEINTKSAPSETSIRDEILTIATNNTLPDLANTPIDGSVILLVNGKAEDSATGGSFSVAGQSLTWNEVNAGFDLTPSDRVIAVYNILK
jgi:hypothetical protein